MKALKVIFVSLLFFTFLTSSAFAGIKISLPKSISGEELVKIFQEASQDVPDVVVKVYAEYSYEPGSVKRIPEHFVIRLYSSEKVLGLFRWRDNRAFIKIELDADSEFLYITAEYPYGNSRQEFSTMNLSQEERIELEGFLKEVYRRLQAK